MVMDRRTNRADEYSFNNKSKSLKVTTMTEIRYYKGEKAVELYKSVMD